MSLEALNLGRFKVTCDDPQKRKCPNETDWFFGEFRTLEKAEEDGWFYSEATEKYACPDCALYARMQSYRLKQQVRAKLAQVNRGVLNNTIDEDYYSDPFMAAMIADALGGNPAVAAEFALLTNDTALGIVFGMLAGDDSPPPTEEFDGAGAGGTWPEPQVEPAPPQIEEIPEEELPVIAEPFRDDPQSQAIAPEPDTWVTMSSPSEVSNVHADPGVHQETVAHHQDSVTSESHETFSSPGTSY